MKTFKVKLPASMREGFLTISGIVIFGARYFKEVYKPPYELKELLKQLFEIGYKSLSLIAVTGFVIGITLTLQSIPSMQKFGAVSLVPSMIALAIILEIGPVISALIFAGKIGSSIGAELGSMKVSEQIDAMEISGTNPFNHLAVTRITATTLMLPVLVIFSNAIAIIGGFIAFSLVNDVSFKLYLQDSFSSIKFDDLIPSVIKTGVFGFAIGVIGCYEGFNASRGTESVGVAANTAVVISSLAVIIIDMINVQLMSILF
ncbi:MAG TPA: ABC transporter permease [Ignavibacteria bacterium]